MPRQQRVPTKYPGVFFVDAERRGGVGTEQVFYIRYRKAGKLIEEPVGRQYADDMTAAKANRIRGDKIENRKPTRREERAEQQAVKNAEAERPSLARLWSEYIADHPNLKGKTTDENRFRKHIGPLLGDEERKKAGYKSTLADKTPEEIVPLDLDRLRLALSRDHAPATVRNVLELVRRVVNFGVRKRRTAGLSFKIGSKKAGAAVQMPEVHNLKTEDLNPEQLSALLKAIDAAANVQAANFMRMVLYTGTRRGELFRLRWDDVDFHRQFIRLRDPKGGRDQLIPLNDSARALLESHPRPYGEKSPFVFPGRKGEQRADINKQVNEIKRAAGLPADFRALHGLRHVYASMLASSGEVDLYTLQKLLTHKSPQMTQRYAHLRDGALRKASALAGNLISTAAESSDGQEQEQGEP